MTLAVGIEIGGTKLQAGVGTGEGRPPFVARRKVDPAKGARAILEALPALVDDALRGAGSGISGISGVGIGFGGPVDTLRGVTLLSNQVGGWQEFPLRKWAQEAWGRPVALQNDAKAAGLAEAKLGAGRGARRIFYVTVGSGIGGGCITEGAIDEGQGLGAGEIGHTWVPHPETGRPERLELVASGWSIARRAGSASAEEVHAAAERGDEGARKILAEAAGALGLGIANVASLLHPERIVIGGGVSNMGPLFWNPLRESFERRLFGPFAGRCQIVPAALGEEVVVAGAVLLGLGAVTQA